MTRVFTGRIYGRMSFWTPVYLAPVSTDRVGKKQYRAMLFANTARGHGYTLPEFTARQLHGP